MLNVFTVCTVIPDGFELSRRGAPEKLRISVMVSPVAVSQQDPYWSYVSAPAAPPKIDLPRWPTAVTSLLSGMNKRGGIRILMRSIGTPEWTALHARLSRHDESSFASHVSLAQQTWERAFPSPDDFEALHKVLVNESRDRIARAAEGQKKSPQERAEAKYTRAGAKFSPASCAAVDNRTLGNYLALLHAREIAHALLSNGNEDAIRDAREYSRRMASVLESSRKSAWSDERQQGVLAKSRKKMAERLAQYAYVSEYIASGHGERYVDEEAPTDPIKNALLAFDDLSGTDWLSRASLLVADHVFMQEYATAYQRSALDAKEAEQVARRRLTGLKSQPTLAKLTRLLVDVEIDVPQDMRSALGRGATWYGEVAAEFWEDISKAPPEHRLERRDDPESSKPYDLISTRALARRHGNHLSFGPCSRYEWPTPYSVGRKRFLPLASGFLHLRADPGRFYLRTFDTLLGTVSNGTGAAQQEEAKRRGADASVDRTPSLCSQGIQLGDSKADLDAATDLMKSLALAPQRREPLFAEDLLLGFRVDVERTPKGDEKGSPSWHTAVGRTLTYQDIPLPANQSHLFPAFEERDDGFVAALLRHDQTRDGAWSFARQELFSWTGDSLAIPAPGDSEDSIEGAGPHQERAPGRRLACLVPGHDLNIGVTYDSGTGSRSKIPALRLGDHYRFALRACYANGGGPRFDTTKYSELYQSCSLGESGLAATSPERRFDQGAANAADEWPIRFTTPDPVLAPSLALLARDPFVRADRPEITQPGEKLNQLVLRWEHPYQRVGRRVLLPPRVAFEQAEIQKQFDDIDDPQGALRFMRLDLVRGALPHAAAGSSTITGSAGTHRGAVFELTLMQRRKSPYFCDARARYLVLSLQRPGTTAGSPGQQDVSLPLENLGFWRSGDHPDRAWPILVEFRIARFGATGARFVGEPEMREFDSGGRFKALRVVVEVGLAEKIEVSAWCLDENIVDHNLLIHTLVGMKRSSKTAAESLNATLDGLHHNKLEGAWTAQAITRAFGLRPPTPLSDHLNWTVTAAVRRPLSPPRLEPVDGQILIVRRLRAADAVKRWAITPRPADEPEGTQLFIDALVHVHRRSADQLRVQLLWREFNDATSVSSVDGKWSFAPPLQKLERSLSVPLAEGIASAPVALDWEATAQSNPLTFGFHWQATRIGVRLVTRSRFAHCYAEPEAGSASDPAFFETESHPTSAFLKAGGEPDEERSFWLNATRRPPRPEVSEVKAVRHEDVIRSAFHVVANYHWTVRLVLPRGSWHQSGEGELLAVVLLPGNAVSTVRVEEPERRHLLDGGEFRLSDELRRLDMRFRQLFSDPTSPEAENLATLASYVSKWGRDASTDTGHLQPILSPGQFSGWIEKRAEVPLPFIIETKGRDGEKKEVEANVAIIAYEPLLNPSTGNRFVDIEFLSPDVDAPFVGLSVCRYQPHSLDGLWLSSQLLLDPCQLSSPRRVEMTWVRRHVLKVKVVGPAYRRRKLGRAAFDIGGKEEELQKLNAHAIDVPWIRFHVQRLNEDGTPILKADLEAQPLQAAIPALVIGEQGVWEVEFKVPPGIRHWRVFASEFEYFTSAAEMDKEPELQEVPRDFSFDGEIEDPSS